MKREKLPWAKENQSDIVAKIILFMFSPFLSAVYSVRKINTKSSYIIFFLFAVFFGMAFSVPSGKNADFTLDGAFYRHEFDQYVKAGKALYLFRWYRFLSFEGANKDTWFDTTAYLLSRVTDNYHFMFMIFSIIFAFFALKSLRFLTSEKTLNFSIQSLILVFLFMGNQIFNINGVRFWTAAWIAVFSIFQIFKNGNKLYFLLAITTPLIHGAYWTFFVILVIIHFLSKYKKILVALYFISFLVSNFSLVLLQNSIPLLPESFARMVEGYTSAKYIESINNGSGFFWVSQLFQILTLVYLNIMVILLIINSKVIVNEVKTKALFLFLIFWMSFSNFFMIIPSVGERFILLAYPLISYIWLVHFKGRKYQVFLLFLPIVFFMWIYSNINIVNKVIAPSFFVSNPIYLIYKYLIIG